MNETEKPLWVLIKRGYNCSLSIAVKLLIEITTKLLIQKVKKLLIDSKALMNSNWEIVNRMCRWKRIANLLLIEIWNEAEKIA